MGTGEPPSPLHGDILHDCIGTIDGNLIVIPSDNSRNLLQLRPKEVLKHVVSFCDPPFLILMAATCQPYWHLVFHDYPTLWDDIDFGKVPERHVSQHRVASCAYAKSGASIANNVKEIVLGVQGGMMIQQEASDPHE